MVRKKYYLFFLSIFVQLFSMEEPAISKLQVAGLPLEIWQKIVCSNYDYGASIKCLTTTCHYFNRNLTNNMFIKDDTDNHIRDEWGNRILSPHIAHTMYKDDFYLCRLALSSCAKCCLKTKQCLYEDYFKQFYVFHAEQRNAGVKGVLGIKGKPEIEDCITVYGGNCYRESQIPKNCGYHKSPSTSAHESYNLLMKMSELIIDEDINAINTIFLDDRIGKEGKSPEGKFVRFEEIAKELCFLDDCYIKKILKDNGFYMMPLLVSNNGIGLEKVRNNIAVRIFASILRYKKEIRIYGKGNLIDTICEDIEPNNRGLFFLIWMHNLEYYWSEKIKYENDFIKKFINTKKIELNQTDEHGERTLDYVYNRAKNLVHDNRQQIDTLIDLGCNINEVDSNHKTLLQREGEKFYDKLLLNHYERDVSDMHREVLYVLLEKKIEQLTQSKQIDKPIDDYGNAVLHYACIFGWCGLIDRILAEGADINIQNKDGMTSFFVACLRLYNISHEKRWNENGYSFDTCINRLCDYGADVNKVDSNNRLPWHIMCDALRCFLSKMTCPSAWSGFSNYCESMVKKLFKCGANIHMRTADGKLAYHGLYVDSEIESYLFHEKIRPLKTATYYGLGALCVYGVFKYFQDK